MEAHTLYDENYFLSRANNFGRAADAHERTSDNVHLQHLSQS